MNALAHLLDERVQVARVKAAAAAAEARMASGSDTAQAAADQAIADLNHFVQVRDALNIDRSGPYRPESPNSFFSDCVRSVQHGDKDAHRRLQLSRELRSTSGALGGLIVPRTLEQLMADSGHNGRPLCDLLAQELPDTGMVIVIPEVTSAVTSELQQTQNTAATADSPASEARNFNVVTVFAEVTVSEQSIDRAEGQGFDVMVGREVLGALNALQETLVINGSGSSGEPTGALASGAGTVSATGTTAYDILDAIAEGAATIDDSRSSGADLVVLHPRRWRWILANAGDRSAAITTVSDGGPVVGRLLGLDVVASAAMPTTVSTDQDRIVVARRNDLYVAEAPPTVEVLRDRTGSGTLNTRLRVHRYFAAGVVSTEGLQVIDGAGLADPFA